MTLRDEVPKGLLDRRHSEAKFELRRYDPGNSTMAEIVSHYWVVAWDLTGQPAYESESLPYPNVHMVFQRGSSGIFGVPRGKFVRRLTGKDRAFGISFRPGGFHALVQTPVHRFTNRRTLIVDVFGGAGQELEEAMLRTEDDLERIGVAEGFFHARAVRIEPAGEFACHVVDRIAGDRNMLKVEDVARAEGVSRRKLERVFREYVGVGPKWVVQRFRLFEAAESLARDPDASPADLAQQLGYTDQAHFSRDFKMMVGCSPGDYARKASAE
jgi:AraC-like DNA-binding protein